MRNPRKPKTREEAQILINEYGSNRKAAKAIGISHTTMNKVNKRFGIESPASVNLSKAVTDFDSLKKEREGLEDLSAKGYIVINSFRNALVREEHVKIKDRKIITLGYLADSHYGSRYQADDVIDKAYKAFRLAKVDAVAHAGDWFEGSGRVYPGQLYEMFLYGVKPQINYPLNVHPYPSIKGVKTYTISGNHDHSFVKDCGIDPVEEFAKQRDDIIWLGRDNATLVINGIRIAIIHGEGGLGENTLLKARKIVNRLDNPKPHVAIIGHWHISNRHWLKDTCVIMAGCTQRTTPFIHKKNLDSMVGYGILKLEVEDNKLVHVVDDFTTVKV